MSKTTEMLKAMNIAADEAEKWWLEGMVPDYDNPEQVGIIKVGARKGFLAGVRFTERRDAQ